MKFFNPFRRNSQVDKITQEIMEPEKALFVDEEAPNEEINNKSLGVIGEFLGRNHWGMGYSYGHKYQSAEILKNHLAKIQSDFKEVLDQRIQELEEVIDQINQGKIRGEGLSSEVDRLYAKKLEMAHEALKTLVNERDLVSIGEGKVSKVINDFRLGYNEGTLLAMEEDVLSLNTKV